ncbi:MAG: chromosome segregation protein SMC [Alphaproteobacteria bacterium]
MVAFTKLRIQGFKSFVDATEFHIEPGVTGVVGPNGCGKSNIVEALKWVMGESRSKQLRGADMEEVIFNGSSDRPARNVAEVELVMSNADGSLPPQYAEHPTVGVSRRIERGKGSDYRINKSRKTAGEVKLLFSDAGSGASSSAIVSQGRVAAIINAKPVERRQILEEAAGIVGLAARRREAENRLRAAESNLERLETVMNALQERLKTLEGQAKQAEKYRRLTDKMTRLNAQLHYLQWVAQTRTVERAKETLVKAEKSVADAEAQAARANQASINLSTDLPDLQKQEAEAGAKLQAFLVAKDGLERDKADIDRALQNNSNQRKQLEHDQVREANLVTDAQSALERLAAEEADLVKSSEGEAQALQALETAVETANAAVSALEQDMANARADVARVGSEITARTTTLNQAKQRLEALSARRERLEGQIADIEARETGAAEHAEARSRATELQAEHDAAATALTAAETAMTAARETEQSLRAQADALAREEAQLRAELRGLQELLKSSQGQGKTDADPVLSSLRVQDGFETALAAVIGDALQAPAGSQEKGDFWLEVDGVGTPEAFPASVTRLSEVVDAAPQALSRRLMACGIAASVDEAASLQSQLRPGQRLTTKDGGLWRWDGYTALPGKVPGAARLLEQRRRAEELEAVLAGKAEETAQARNTAETAAAELKEARATEAQSRQTLQLAYRDLTGAQSELARVEAKAAKVEAESGALRAALQTLNADHEEAQTAVEAAQKAFDDRPDAEAMQSRVDTLRPQVDDARRTLTQAQAEREQHKRDASARKTRMGAITTERFSWDGRLKNAEHQHAQLKQRDTRLTEERQALENRPAEIAQQRETLENNIRDAREAVERAVAAVSDRRAASSTADAEARQAEKNAGAAREELVTARLTAETEIARKDELAAAIKDTFSAGPQALPGLAELDPAGDLPLKGDTDRALKAAIRDRDALGAVNLRAEDESTELSDELSTYDEERADLNKAIDKLRKAIASLNKEGRLRLADAFKKVNEAFQETFTRLFNGGTAHLELIDGDDPLNAGLEIFAQPPGKKLTSLALMSGGEQSMTATALIFSLLQTNPAPICVLDEVDAPLDDHNVARFCDLVGEWARKSNTRIVVVTHHPVTMSRVDRLFGVTMAERGVSSLLSIDLDEALVHASTAEAG